MLDDNEGATHSATPTGSNNINKPHHQKGRGKKPAHFKETWWLDKKKTETYATFFYIEAVCNSWFLFEILVRFLVAPDRRAFSRDSVNVIDFVATISFIYDLIVSDKLISTTFNYLQYLPSLLYLLFLQFSQCLHVCQLEGTAAHQPLTQQGRASLSGTSLTSNTSLKHTPL